MRTAILTICLAMVGMVGCVAMAKAPASAGFVSAMAAGGKTLKQNDNRIIHKNGGPIKMISGHAIEMTVAGDRAITITNDIVHIDKDVKSSNNVKSDSISVGGTDLREIYVSRECVDICKDILGTKD